MRKIFHRTSALVMGLGLHGGGVATSKWLIKHGARVSATDMRSEHQLRDSLHALRHTPIRFILGQHREEDFMSHDMIIVNPAVPRESPYLRIARRNNKRLENDTSLFFRYIKNPTIAVTGTRGKTTTTLWIAELLKKKYHNVRPSGNTPENALLKEFERINGKHVPAVVELSSWQLEFLPVAKRAPHIAVITNLFPDHLNRYHGMKDYANAKANIFRDQKKSDIVILNFDNLWFRFFARKKHKSQLFVVSTHPLPLRYQGIYLREGRAILRIKKKETEIVPINTFSEHFGAHNLENLLIALLAVRLFDPSIKVGERDILKLKGPRMREEIIVDTKRLRVVNDSCATSPDGTIAALNRFWDDNAVLIAGGTDKELQFAELAQVIAKNVPTNRLVLLEGSATENLLRELRRLNYRAPKPKKNLRGCVVTTQKFVYGNSSKVTLIFSPGAASFEKFLHEFDRGEQFNKLVLQHLG
jgi:UDP-N-acetylmuramoylalanine--D-glutamate ligase